jgi:hypothetical protein
MMLLVLRDVALMKPLCTVVTGASFSDDKKLLANYMHENLDLSIVQGMCSLAHDNYELLSPSPMQNDLVLAILGEFFHFNLFEKQFSQIDTWRNLFHI